MTSPKELTIIERVPEDLRRHGIVPMIVYITKDQQDAITRLNMELTSCVQVAINDDIKIFSDLAEEEGCMARLEAAAVRMTPCDEQKVYCYDCKAREACLKNIEREGSRPALIRDIKRFVDQYKGFMACITDACASDRFSLREGK
ncbi:MAG: hypothetical protein WCH85_07715 [Methanomicrobiales archaeon]